MDLRFCPECKQSVLDEDVEECPFCGASLSGGPAAPKKAAAPQKKRGLTPRTEAKETPKSAPTSNAQKKSAPQKVASGSGQPGFLKNFGGAADPADDAEIFNFDKSKLVKAPTLLPKPKRGVTYRIVCPMCETAGFAPHTYAGKEVRCRNKECMVPVFEAPKVGGDQRKHKQEEKNSQPLLYTTIATVAVVLIGWFLIWFLSRPDTSDDLGRGLNIPVTNNNSNTNEANSSNQTEDTATDSTGIVLPEKDVLTELEIKQAREAGNYTNNRSMPDGLRMSAEIHAVRQQTEQMQADLERLNEIGAQYPYLAIPALTEHGWNLLAANETEALNENFERIQGLMKNLRGRGRFRLECGMRVAALAWATGNQDYAREIAAGFDQRDKEGLLSALIYVSERINQWDIDDILFRSLSQPWTSPFHSAVTIDLVTRSKSEMALDWVLSTKMDKVRSDCTVDWIRTVLRTPEANNTITEEQLNSMVSAVDNQMHAVRICAAMYVGLAHSQKDMAAAYLTKAEEVAANYSVPEPLALKSLKDIHDQRLNRLPAVDDRMLEMQALAELARAEVIAGQGSKGWEYITQSIQAVRSLSPSPQLTRDHRERMQNATQTMRALSRELNIDAPNKIAIALSEYERNLDVLERRAEDRFEAQWTLLYRAIRWGLAADVWKTLASSNAIRDGEPYATTPLLQLLEIQFRQKNQRAEADRVFEMLNRLDPLTDPTNLLIESLAGQLTLNDTRNAADILNGSKVPAAEKELITLFFINRLVRDRKLSAAIDLTKRIQEPLMQEDAWMVLSGQAIADEQVMEFWSIMQRQDLTPTKWLSICRGAIPELVDYIEFLEELEEAGSAEVLPTS